MRSVPGITNAESETSLHKPFPLNKKMRPNKKSFLYVEDIGVFHKEDGPFEVWQERFILEPPTHLISTTFWTRASLQAVSKQRLFPWSSNTCSYIAHGERWDVSCQGGPRYGVLYT